MNINIIKIKIPPNLFNLTKGKKSFDVNGETIAECLKQLVNTVPKLKEFLFFEKDEVLKLRSNVNVLLNGENIAADTMQKEVQEGDEIEIKLGVQ